MNTRRAQVQSETEATRFIPVNIPIASTFVASTSRWHDGYPANRDIIYPRPNQDTMDVLLWFSHSISHPCCQRDVARAEFLVIKDGAIAAQRSHRELIRRRGRCYARYTQQSLAEFADEENHWQA